MSKIPFIFSSIPTFFNYKGYFSARKDGKHFNNLFFVYLSFSKCRNECQKIMYLNREIILKPYQFIFGYEKWSEDTGLTIKNLRIQIKTWTDLKHLKKIDHPLCNKFSIYEWDVLSFNMKNVNCSPENTQIVHNFSENTQIVHNFSENDKNRESYEQDTHYLEQDCMLSGQAKNDLTLHPQHDLSNTRAGKREIGCFNGHFTTVLEKTGQANGQANNDLTLHPQHDLSNTRAGKRAATLDSKYKTVKDNNVSEIVRHLFENEKLAVESLFTFSSSKNLSVRKNSISNWIKIYGIDYVEKHFRLLIETDVGKKKKGLTIEKPEGWLGKALKENWLKISQEKESNKLFATNFKAKHKIKELKINSRYAVDQKTQIEFNYDLENEIFKQKLINFYSNR